MNAFELGWIDAERGIGFGFNPFSRETAAWSDWRNGWIACQINRTAF